MSLIQAGLITPGLISSGLIRESLEGVGDQVTYKWTPNFNGLTVFGGLFDAWSPTGNNSTLEIVFYYAPDGSDQQLLSKNASAFDLNVDAASVLSFNLISNVFVNGLAATSGVTVVPSGYNTITADIDTAADIQFIGALV